MADKKSGRKTYGDAKVTEGEPISSCIQFDSRPEVGGAYGRVQEIKVMEKTRRPHDDEEVIPCSSVPSPIQFDSAPSSKQRKLGELTHPPAHRLPTAAAGAKASGDAIALDSCQPANPHLNQQTALESSLADFRNPPPEYRLKPELTRIKSEPLEIKSDDTAMTNVTRGVGLMSIDEGIATVESAGVSTVSPVHHTQHINAATGPARLRLSPTASKNTDSYYRKGVIKAVHCLAFTNDASKAMAVLISACPQALLSIESEEYQESPTGQALLRGYTDLAKDFVNAAELGGVTNKVLRHRNSAKHTLLMLAVDTFDNGSEDSKNLLEKLLKEFPTQVHECYDVEGRNVFHHCAADNRATALDSILTWLARNQQRCDPSNVAAALRMPDGRCRTPVHYIAEVGNVHMLHSLARYAKATSVTIDFDWHWRGAFDRTPLMLAAERGHADVCQWLLEQGSVRLSIRATDSGQTALEMAQDANKADVVELLKARLHIADESEYLLPERDYFDDDDMDNEDDIGFEEGCETDCGVASVSVATDSAQTAVGNDLDKLDSDARSRLCEELRQLKLYDRFFDRLKNEVPELGANPGFLELSQDPLYLSISLAAGSQSPGVNLALLARLLEEVGAPGSLLKPCQHRAA